MGIKDLSFSANDIENLANELTLLYFKCNEETFTDPKDLTHRFVETQGIISEELKSIRYNR